MFHWALTAAAVLALLYAVRVLFSSAKQRDAARQRLGFGFSVAAAGLWIYVLRHHLGDFGLAVRLAGAVLLTLPAVSALASPARANIMRALLGLFLAVLLAGPAVQQLWTQYGPDTRPAHVQQLETKLEQVRTLRIELEQQQSTLTTLRTSTVAELQSLGKSWAELENNPAALAKLELLSAVRNDLAKLEQSLGDLRNDETRLTAAMEAGDQERVSESLDRVDEIEHLRRELEDQSTAKDSSLVEQHLRTQELREVYDQELGTH